ncbi:MAG: ATP-dependent helicase [Bacteriovoracaceae bacterium]|nr:ATP-dependent helicase [Bacteriovoracaceae bacterium]
MSKKKESISDLWKSAGFSPNRNQEDAILYNGGPLFLPAGPGSGKTRVLLWRVVNLILYHNVEPCEIFLSTFTEKAASQLKDGLESYLSMISDEEGKIYDLSEMYIGTVHSLCQRLLTDRRFSVGRKRNKPPILLDELDQYMFVTKRANWDEFVEASGLPANLFNEKINEYFGDSGKSRHSAASNLISAFNRFSEELLDVDDALDISSDDDILHSVLMAYKKYLELLSSSDRKVVDFALIQAEALHFINQNEKSGDVFKHVIIDEYQDTNYVQERLVFKLSEGSKNLCVVGDDDQALYRFRGATVENFVEFPERCHRDLKVEAKKIPLDINYRSREHIVNFCKEFINKADWSHKEEDGKYYRVHDKVIKPHREERLDSVFATRATNPEDVADEIAEHVVNLLASKRVENPNQIAFLFPSLQFRGEMNTQVQRMKSALEKRGLSVYAPRAGKFLDTDEAIDMFSVLGRIFDLPVIVNELGGTFRNFTRWIDLLSRRGTELESQDPKLKSYIEMRRDEISQVVKDLKLLEATIEENNWKHDEDYLPSKMEKALAETKGLSKKAASTLQNKLFRDTIQYRLSRKGTENAKEPFKVNYAIRAATSLDWTIMDIYWQLCGFRHFKKMFDLAEKQGIEKPICNLSMISNYLERFVDSRPSILTAGSFTGHRFTRAFWSSYIYALYARGESEFENPEVPFPKECIPFLTIHQSKGLEFPVVVLGNPRKGINHRKIEEVMTHLKKKKGEPLELAPYFDIMRLYYVALSRAKNELIIANFRSRGNFINDEFKELVAESMCAPLHSHLVSEMPFAEVEEATFTKTYSYTADYLFYDLCPRQYMIFRAYDFSPSRTQGMFFGNLVHQTIEDLHNYLIAQREDEEDAA